MADRAVRILLAAGVFFVSTYGAWWIAFNSKLPTYVALVVWAFMLVGAKRVYYSQLPADCLEPRDETDTLLIHRVHGDQP